MIISDSLTSYIKDAMKSKDKERLEALRAIKSAFLLAKTEKGAQEELSDDAELKIIQKLVKQRRDSADEYLKQNRKDLADKEILEADVISEFLPKQLSEEELKAEVTALIQEAGATSVKEMGKVMGLANARLAGKADGKVIADMVKQLLS